MLLTLHTSLVVLHLIGVVLGVGGATAADFLILRRAIFAPIEASLTQTVHFISHLVTGGLILLWVSGTGLFFEIWQKTPAYSTNQKLWAKVTIVAVLTINALIIHRVILPKLKTQVGRRLFSGVSLGDQMAFAVSSAISGVSWYIPLVLGPAREWSYVVPFATVMMAYMWILNAAVFGIICIAIWSTRPEDGIPTAQTQDQLAPNLVPGIDIESAQPVMVQRFMPVRRPASVRVEHTDARLQRRAAYHG